jgi:hypothetical protein
MGCIFRVLIETGSLSAGEIVALSHGIIISRQTVRETVNAFDRLSGVT